MHPFLPPAGLALLAALLLGSCDGASQPLPRSTKTAIVYRDFYLRHNDIEGQVEHPDRLRVIMKRLRDTGLLDRLERLAPPPADLEWILQVHTPQHIERVRQGCRWIKNESQPVDTADAGVTGRSFDVAVCAVGGILGGVDAVMSGRVRNAFCAIRPPGHHASSNQAMGLCLFNNVAIAARYLQRRHGLEKIMIIDWDCHHGNGTQEIFDEDPTVFYFSTHQSPFYPKTGFAEETGIGRAVGTKMNVLLKRGSTDADILKAYQERLRPAVLAFKPDFILISAGFDAARGDLLGGLELTPDAYTQMTRIVKELAETCCKGRLVSTLEGGYSLKQLPGCVEAHVRALME
ncbi:MAG: histone deacetylase [Planctomycetes bacterium]|nr:histone deacetylase [Planctomycetota bacterium]